IIESISFNQDLYINAYRILANPSSYATEEKNSAYSININPQLSTRAVNTYENEIKNTNQAMAANQTTTNAMEKQSEIL
ncbi:flagellin, partial [Aliarcobacter butzleri]